MTGQTVSHYRILEKLGEGGMGVVWKAEDLLLKRIVALKFLHASDDMPRLLREAQTAGSLNHPNICTIHEVDPERGFLAMELVEGESLAAKIGGRPLPVEEAVGLAAQIGEGLKAAHAKGIIHRDIKSGNILVTADGRAKILDFGLARAPGQAALTREGASAGTPGYMAPEQMRGEAVDRRTDIWALGAVLHEMLTGRLPMGQADTLPEGLGRVVRKALAAEPRERYQHIEDMLVDLRRAAGPARVEIRRAPSRRRLLAAAFAVGVLAVAATLWLRGRGDHAGNVESLAVLPLKDLSEGTVQGYFADGMTEALITDLGKVGSLRVMARSAVERYKNERKSPAEIGRELNVHALMEGSVLRAGGRVRVALRLVSASNGQQIWSESYEREMRDVLALQGEVSRTVAAAIQVKLEPQQIRRLSNRGTVDPRAYDLYLQAKQLSAQVNLEDNTAAIGLFEQAVSIDPGLAAAWGELATAYLRQANTFAPSQHERWFAKAEAAIGKAFALDPDSAEAYEARSALVWNSFRGFDHVESARACRKALSINPSSSRARYRMTNSYWHVGMTEESLKELSAGLAVDPTYLPFHHAHAFNLMLTKRLEEALARWGTLPANYHPHFVTAHVAWTLYRLNRKTEAWQALEASAKRGDPDPGGLMASVWALLYADAGDRKRSEAEIRVALLDQGPEQFHHATYFVAAAFVRLGRPADAIKWLRFTVDNGFLCYPQIEWDPDFDSLRKDPQFSALLASIRKQVAGYRQKLAPDKVNLQAAP